MITSEMVQQCFDVAKPLLAKIPTESMGLELIAPLSSTRGCRGASFTRIKLFSPCRAEVIDDSLPRDTIFSLRSNSCVEIDLDVPPSQVPGKCRI